MTILQVVRSGGLASSSVRRSIVGKSLYHSPTAPLVGSAAAKRLRTPALASVELFKKCYYSFTANIPVNDSSPFVTEATAGIDEYDAIMNPFMFPSLPESMTVTDQHFDDCAVVDENDEHHAECVAVAEREARDNGGRRESRFDASSTSSSASSSSSDEYDYDDLMHMPHGAR